MKYESILEKLKANSYSRNQLAQLKLNTQAKVDSGDVSAKLVLEAIDYAIPVDTEVVFMGFCPDSDFGNRLDIEWKEKGICRFDFTESKQQLERFYQIANGDLIVLKKREKFGKTMNLYGYGRVSAIRYDQDKVRFLEVDWSEKNQIIEVPLMGCNSTVDVRSIEFVNDSMSEEYFDWVGSPLKKSLR